MNLYSVLVQHFGIGFTFLVKLLQSIGFCLNGLIKIFYCIQQQFLIRKVHKAVGPIYAINHGKFILLQ